MEPVDPKVRDYMFYYHILDYFPSLNSLWSSSVLSYRLENWRLNTSPLNADPVCSLVWTVYHKCGLKQRRSSAFS